MNDISRRSFVGMGASLAAASGLAAVGAAQAEPTQAHAPTTHVGESDLDMYRTHTPLTTINEIRRELIDAAGDTVCDDGTPIPAIWHKCRVLVDCLGAGTGYQNTNTPENYLIYKYLCNNDEQIAEIYVNTPVGIRFTAFDAAVETGRSVEECTEALDVLAHNGAMYRINIGGIYWYAHQRVAHGIVEASQNLYMVDGFDTAILNANTSTLLPFPLFYPMPVNKDIVVEDTILPYDDIEALLERHTIFAVSPCQCRYFAQILQPREELPHMQDQESVKDFVCADGHHLEKCFVFGEEAEYYIELGIAREVTREEMRELLNRQIEEGCIMNSCYTKYTEVICSCDKGCALLPMMSGFSNDSVNYANQSHYDLMYDKDLCLKCGICANRCPLSAVEMGEDGYPSITGYCYRCGQCAYACPAEARKLTAKDATLIPEMPEDLLDWINKDTMWRYEAGEWPYAQA